MNLVISSEQSIGTCKEHFSVTSALKNSSNMSLNKCEYCNSLVKYTDIFVLGNVIGILKLERSTLANGSVGNSYSRYLSNKSGDINLNNGCNFSTVATSSMLSFFIYT